MPSRWKSREAEIAMLTSGKVDSKPKLVRSARKGLYLLIKKIYQEYIMDIYFRTNRFIKQTQLDVHSDMSRCDNGGNI